MKSIPRIAESEWQVMQVLWRRGPATANDVVEALSGTSSWKPKTIKTLLNRLVKKRAIGFDKDGRQYRYFPLLSEAECAGRERRSFLQRVYGGSLTPMLASFLKEADLSAEDIAALRKILEERG